jgi:predicted enzyme related to lactoylglutathione lyase
MKVGYLQIPVSDVKESANFFEKLFGKNKLFESPSHVIFNCDGVEIAIISGGQKGKKEGTKGIYFVVDDVDKVFNELKSRGVEFQGEPANESWGGRIVCFTDPDGNKYGIYKMLERK